MKKLVKNLSVVFLMTMILVFGVMFFPTVTTATRYIHGNYDFTITFPDGWDVTSCIWEDQVLSVRDPSNTTTLHIHCGDLKEGAKLEDAGKRHQALLKSLSVVKYDELVSSKVTKLKNGTPASESVHKWKWANTSITSLVLIVYQGKKWIRIGINKLGGGELGELEKEIAYSLWVSEIAEEIYVNKEHGFTVKYPNSYKPQPFMYEEEVLRVAGQGASCVIVIRDLPEDAKLEDEGKTFEDRLKSFDIGTNIKLISSEPTKTQDGTPARLFVIEWKWQGNLPLSTLAITAYKEKKIITLETHNWGGPDKKAEVKAIVESLTFK